MRLPQPEPDKWLSAGLAMLVHAVLAALLILGVRWQTRAPEAVEVQLYAVEPAQERQAVHPAPAAPREVPPPPRPEPKPVVKPEPKAVPKVEAKPEPRPEIARKAPERKKPAEAPKAPEKAVQKPLSPRDWSQELSAAEQSVSRQKATDAAAKELQEMKAAQAAGRRKAEETWIGKIRAKIRSHTVVPPGVSGDPEAVFDVSILPDGTVLSVKLKKPTGFPALDAAIERAIQKASPLPKPDDPAVFSRELRITHNPLRE